LKNTEPASPTMRRSATNRSAITNGNRQFALGGDGRGAWVRRWRDLAELHMIDRGGENFLSESQKSLCRRAATLEVNLEQLEANMSEGQGVDLDVYNRLAGNLRRLFETLGLERKAKDVGTTVFRIIGGLPPPPMQTQSNGSLSLPEKESVG
jgi:hypothetical protein